MLNINKNDIKKVYSGKAGKCCCGCAGTYWDNVESNERQINRIMKKVQEAQEQDVCETYVAAEIGSRLYIVYFN